MLLQMLKFKSIRSFKLRSAENEQRRQEIEDNIQQDG